MNFILGFLKGLKLPIKLLKGWLKKRRKRNELEEKCRKHVRNFAPTHYSWQKSIGKGKRKKPRKKKDRKFSVKSKVAPTNSPKKG